MFTKRPRILMTNDDGIHAPGIFHLWNSLKEIADITIVAPVMEQSSVGLGMTLRHPIRINKVEWPENVPAWSVTGTPVDCIKMGMSVVLNDKPDLILSGINRGSNAGRNMLYSGTVAGVIEGTLRGIPGIAFSCVDYTNTNYKKIESYIPMIIGLSMEHSLPLGTFFNVNFPEQGHEIKGLKLTRQGKELWGESPSKREHPSEGHFYYWLGSQKFEFDEHEDSDITWLNKGYITVVPVHIGELTDFAYLNKEKDYFDDALKNSH